MSGAGSHLRAAKVRIEFALLMENLIKIFCRMNRQEYLGMQAKYNALENRSRELLLSHGSAVSGASVALAGLGNRLELLVEQLISSYNISEQDLEVSLKLQHSVHLPFRFETFS